MAATPESKPPFWSSLQGILTGVGGVIVAFTGLITAYYTIGPKPNSNTAPQTNTAVMLSSVPSASPTPSAENDRYKMYAGTWMVTETPSLDFTGAKKVTWRYEASVTGSVLTMKGKVSEIDGNKNLPKGAEDVSSTIVVPLVNSGGMGDYKTTKTDGMFRVGIRIDDADPPGLHGTIEKAGRPICGLMGKKERF
jgi:hypothetical protein